MVRSEPHVGKASPDLDLPVDEKVLPHWKICNCEDSLSYWTTVVNAA